MLLPNGGNKSRRGVFSN